MYWKRLKDLREDRDLKQVNIAEKRFKTSKYSRNIKNNTPAI